MSFRKQISVLRVAGAVCGLVACASLAPYAYAANGSWNVDLSGTWSTTSNWSPSASPGTAAGDVVGLANNITANRTVTISTNVTLGTLNIGDTNTTNTFTLALTTGGTLTLNNGGTGATISQLSTSRGDTISAGFTLSDNLAVSNAATLYALNISGDIAESGGPRNLTKSGSGTVVLSGANTYSGTTTINAGMLQFGNTASLYNGDSSNWTPTKITTGSGATLAVSVGSGSFFTSGNVTTLLTNLGGLGGSINNNGLRAGSSIGFDTSNAGGVFTIVDAIKNASGTGGGAIGLVKLGSGTLSLTGLSSTAANNYTGATVIDQGTLVLPSSQTTRLSGGLTFGASAASTNAGALDLSTASAEFAGPLLVQTSVASSTNTIQIGMGQSLSTNGGVSVGPTTLSNARLTVSGSGTWNITQSTGTLSIGGTISPNGSMRSLNAKDLATLSINLLTTGTTVGGTVQIGSSNGPGNGTGSNEFWLAETTTITANTLALGNTSAGDAQRDFLYLGSGSQTLNVNTFTLGSGLRGAETVMFSGSTGSLRLRGAASGTSRADVNIVAYAGGSRAGLSGTLDLSGHAADLLMKTVTIQFSNNSVNSPSGSAVFTFDSGTFDATAVNIAQRGSSASGSGTFPGTLNLGGTNNLSNTFMIGTLSMASLSSASATSTVNGTINIAGTVTSGTITSATLASTSATSGTANGVMNISGGATRITNGITLVSRSGTAPGVANGALSITGGSLSVGGNIATSGSLGTITSTVTLDGGSLNMNGFGLGAASQLIDTLGLRSGTLSNVGQINNGADLVKTTTGTLTLTGTSTYTGATNVQAGVVRFNSVAATTGGQALGSGSVVNLGVAGTSTGEIDYYAATSGTLDKNVFALGSGRNRIRNSGSGTLTLSGTLTKDGTILELAQGTFIVAGKITGASANSDFYINGATVTLANASNDYNGPTYVYGGGRLVLGTSNVIPSGSPLTLGATGSDSGSGTLDLSSYSDVIGGLSFGTGGGTLKMAASQTATAQLVTSSALSLGAGTTLDLTGMGTSAGLYRLVSGTSLSGSFGTVTGLNSDYVLRYGTVNASSIDAQRKADQSATFTMTTGGVMRALINTTVAISGSVTNSTFANGSNLAVSLSTGSGLTVGSFGSGTSSVAPQASTSVAGVIQTGTLVGTRSWSVINSDNGAITTTSTASGALDVVNQRSFSVSNSGTINLGNFLRTVAVSGSATVSSTGVDATTARASLGAFAGTNTNGFSLGSAGTTAFNGASATQTATYMLSGSATSSGSINGSFASTVTAELGTIAPVTVALVGTAYDAASIAIVQTGSVSSSGTLSITNASGSYRSAAYVSGTSLTGQGWSVTGFALNSSAAAGATLAGTAHFDGTGLLSGIYTGTFSATFQNNQGLTGATANDLGSVSWSLYENYINASGTGSTTLAANTSLSAVSLSSGTGAGATVASFAAGVTGASSANVSMSFSSGGTGLFSDVLNLHGTDGLAQVLQLTYDPSLLGGTSEDSLFLAWLDPTTSQWVNSVLGNTNNTVIWSSGFLGSWNDYVTVTSGSATAANSLGAFGVDKSNKTVWAAINHNSQFAVTAAVIVPEPDTVIFAGIGIAMVGWSVWRRRRIVQK